MTVLTATERSFGQQMNLNKSAFYVGARDQHRVPTIAGILGVFHSQLPFYLSWSSYPRRQNKNHIL